MPINVVMPQMGESIAEGTIVRWLKHEGDRVDRDEPLFEISTDKVDAEIPSPAAGVVREIKAKEGETVAVNAVVAVIAEGGDAAAAPAGVAAPPTSAPAPSQPAPAVPQRPSPPVSSPLPPPVASTPPPAVPSAPASAARAATEEQAGGPERPSEADRPDVRETTPPEPSNDELRRQRSSPLVRRIAREHNVDISAIPGTGIGGRVTKHDILDYLDGLDEGGRTPSEGQAPAAAAGTPEVVSMPSTPPPPQAPVPAPPAPGSAARAGDNVEVVPMSVMRRRIAEHMVFSKRTSAHVHSVFEVDFARIARIRDQKKAEYDRAGVKLTYLPFIAKAAIDALREVPVVNASIEGDNIVYKRDINLGIAVALDWGLIVPVVKHADEKNILGLARTIADLANRARSKQLKPEEVQGGTFTITNPGVFGALFGMPIISQPQVAILGVGAVEKRPVVVDDAIAIRPRAYLSLGYDHRLIDGAVADQFMAFLKKRLEEFDANSL